jgi:hypothetical protein
MDLFSSLECDHMPVGQRKWRGKQLWCTKCDRVIRDLDKEA